LGYNTIKNQNSKDIFDILRQTSTFLCTTILLFHGFIFSVAIVELTNLFYVLIQKIALRSKLFLKDFNFIIYLVFICFGVKYAFLEASNMSLSISNPNSIIFIFEKSYVILQIVFIIIWSIVLYQFYLFDQIFYFFILVGLYLLISGILPVIFLKKSKFLFDTIIGFLIYEIIKITLSINFMFIFLLEYDMSLNTTKYLHYFNIFKREKYFQY
ncbi:hypothetical protein TUBRATIS_24560, partial [Tubulinosema ratisbonensis]